MATLVVGGLLLTAAAGGAAAAAAAVAGGSGYLVYRHKKKSKKKAALFGVPLRELDPQFFAPNGIPLIVERLSEQIMWSGAREEGIFRAQGDPEAILELRQQFIALSVNEDPEKLKLTEAKPHDLAGALVSFLVELPEPLCTYELYSQFIRVEDECSHDDTIWVQQIRELLQKLPERNLRLYLKLLPFLHTIASLSVENRMDFGNLGVVFAPLLFWQHMPEGVDHDTLVQSSLREADVISRMVAKMIQLHTALYDVRLDQMPTVTYAPVVASVDEGEPEEQQKAEEQQSEVAPPSYEVAQTHESPAVPRHVPPAKPLPPAPGAAVAASAPVLSPMAQAAASPSYPSSNDFLGT